MNLLYYIVDLSKKIVKKKQRKPTFHMFYLLILPVISLLIAAVFFMQTQTQRDKVTVIDDGVYVQQLFRQAIPLSITLVDPVWGAIAIEQPDKVFEYYQVLSHLPYADGSAELSEITGRELSGTIKFRERSNIDFLISKGVMLDGILYSGDQMETKLAHTVREMRSEFFTPETLGRLLNPNMYVVIRHENQRKNLTVNKKKQLKEIVEQSTLITDSKQLSEALRRKGKALCQIELYTESNQNTEPASREELSIYIVIYENDLAIVYDVEASIGSDMHLKGNWDQIKEILVP